MRLFKRKSDRDIIDQLRRDQRRRRPVGIVFIVLGLALLALHVGGEVWSHARHKRSPMLSPRCIVRSRARFLTRPRAWHMPSDFKADSSSAKASSSVAFSFCSESGCASEAGRTAC